jgi:hypothetical protein
VTGLEPFEGDLPGGNEVDVLGSGFLDALPPLYLRFGSRIVAVTATEPERIRVTVPPGDAVGPVDVALHAPGQLCVLPGGYRYRPAPPPPPVVGFVPRVGQAGTRVDVVLSGFPYLDAPVVRFGGVAATVVQVLGAELLRVEVPPGVPVGRDVEVEVAQGGWRAATPGFRSQGSLAPGVVTINEFLADPGNALDGNRDGTPSSAGDEFVELVNRLTVAVDLSGWSLADASAVRHVFPNPTSIPAGGSLVVFGGGTPIFFALPHASGHAQSATTGTLSLNNTSDAIVLRAVDGEVIAQVSYVSADVDSGVSCNAPLDGQALPVPAPGADYVLHPEALRAVGAISPGLKNDQTPFGP